MSFSAFDSAPWRYFFLLVAGSAATDLWRFLGVYLGGRISPESEWLVGVRAMATALVAAVVGNLLVFPAGALAETAMSARLFAAGAGFIVYLLSGRRMIVGILAAEILLAAAMLLDPPAA